MDGRTESGRQRRTGTGQICASTVSELGRKYAERGYGNFLYFRQPVLQMFLSKLPMTIYLTITSILLTIALSIPLGILSAVRKNKFTDYFIRILSFIGNSMPGFFVALLLMYLFSLKLGWFPVMGSGQGWKSIVLPTLTLQLPCLQNIPDRFGQRFWKN